jgi:hypothetical protein
MSEELFDVILLLGLLVIMLIVLKNTAVRLKSDWSASKVDSQVWGILGGGVSGGNGHFTGSYATHVRFKGTLSYIPRLRMYPTKYTTGGLMRIRF